MKRVPMPATFSLKEYAAAHDLDVMDHDTTAIKMVADHLRALGYEQRRIRQGGTKAQYVWQKSDRKKELATLAEKLAEIEKEK